MPFLRHERRRRHRIHDRGRFAPVGVRLAEDVALERQDPVVVGRAAPQHRGGRHQAALGCLDDPQVAGAAGLARDAIVARVDEADVLGRFAVEQRVAVGRIGARRVLPRGGIARQHVCALDCGAVRGVLRIGALRLRDMDVAAVAVGATEDHGGVDVHRVVVARGVAALAALGLRVRGHDRLALRRRRARRVRAGDPRLALGRGCMRSERGEHDADRGGAPAYGAAKVLCHRVRFQ